MAPVTSDQPAVEKPQLSEAARAYKRFWMELPVKSNVYGEYIKVWTHNVLAGTTPVVKRWNGKQTGGQWVEKFAASPRTAAATKAVVTGREQLMKHDFDSLHPVMQQLEDGLREIYRLHRTDEDVSVELFTPNRLALLDLAARLMELVDLMLERQKALTSIDPNSLAHSADALRQDLAQARTLFARDSLSARTV